MNSTSTADRASTASQVKFSDMAVGCQKRWIVWASSHDWYRNARVNDDGLLLVTQEHEWLTFKTPRELRAWAGY